MSKNHNKPSSTPLDRQVGGNHYRSNVQHVTFCQRNHIPWCEASAIKYIIRHRKKNGRQDLEKAIHYIELCCHEDYVLKETNPKGMDPARFNMTLNTFFLGNSVPKEEALAIDLICSHHVKLGESTLRKAVAVLQRIMDECYPLKSGGELL